ncbi:hypothetical protein TNCV_479641 [Trichonephila clavipes]|nr:hypothetical protein TNCV_479641 [Trichonephila clavipes]
MGYFTCKYLASTTNAFLLSDCLEQQCLQTTKFMQDGATPHIGLRVKELLSANFGDHRVIYRYFPDAWPSRSPDVNLCDFWLR